MPDPIRSPSSSDTHATGAALEAYGRTAPTHPHLGWTPQQVQAWKAQNGVAGQGRPLADVLKATDTYGIAQRGLQQIPGELFDDSRIRIEQYLKPLSTLEARHTITDPARVHDPAAWKQAAQNASAERNAILERTREMVSDKGLGASRAAKPEPKPFEKVWKDAVAAFEKENPAAFRSMDESARGIEVAQRVIKGSAKADPTFNSLVHGADDAARGLKALKYGGRALMVVGAAVDGASIVSEARTSLQTGDWSNTGRQTAKVAGGWLGAAAAGAAVGAVSGTVVPGLGNVAGFVIGAAAGAVGYWLGSRAGEAGFNAVAGAPAH